MGFLIFFCMRFIVKDEPPPLDNDLRVTRLNLPDQENAFYYFNQAIQNYNLVKENKNFKEFIDPEKEWDQKQAEEIVAVNSETFRLISEALRYKLEAPEAKFGTEIRYVREWIILSRLMQTKVLLLAYQNNPAAIEEALKLIKMGHLCEYSGHLVGYLTGGVIKKNGFLALSSVLEKADVFPERTYLDELRKFEKNDDALILAVKGEYLSIADAIERLARGDVNVWLAITSPSIFPDEEDSAPKIKKWLTKTMIETPFFFKPNQTKKTFLRYYKELINDIPKSCSEIDQIEEKFTEEFAPKISINPVNFIGKTFINIYITSPYGILKKKCDMSASARATQLLMALKNYKKQNGRLPDSLVGLVPDFIPVIPLDPYDEKPMKYSAARDSIYSIGDNLMDDGGIADQDLVFKINF